MKTLKTSLFRIRLLRSIAGDDILWCDFWGDSYATIKSTKANRKKLAGQFRHLADELDRDFKLNKKCSA